MKTLFKGLTLLIASATTFGCGAGLGDGPLVDATTPGDPAGKVLFVGTEPSGRTDLYLIGDEGEGLTALTSTLAALDSGRTITTTSEAALGPVPSPDGAAVLFTLQRPGSGTANQTLHELDVYEGSVQSLGAAPPGLRRAFYDRSGTRILLDIRDPDSGESQLSQWSENGLINLSPDGAELTFDAFFPDDDRLLVRHGSGDERALAILDLADGSVSDFATAGGLEILSPRLSADGHTVVFQGRGDAEACYDLFMVPAPPCCFDSVLTEPTSLWAAAGAWDALYGDINPPGDHTPGDDATPAGSRDDDTPVEAAGYATSECLSVSSPSWAPDGSGRIAFMATSDTERADAFVLNIDDGAVTALSTEVAIDGPGVTSAPRWSPSGEALLFSVSWSENDGASSYVDLMVSDGEGAPVVMTEGFDGVPSLAHWESNGERILFWARTSADDTSSGTSDAVVVDVSTGAIDSLTGGRGLHVAWPLWLDTNSLYY